MLDIAMISLILLLASAMLGLLGWVKRIVSEGSEEA